MEKQILLPRDYDYIDYYAARLIKEAKKQNSEITGRFNGYEFLAKPNDTVKKIRTRYLKLTKGRLA